METLIGFGVKTKTLEIILQPNVCFAAIPNYFHL